MTKASKILYPYYLVSFVVTASLAWTTVIWWWIPATLGTFLALLYFWMFRPYELFFFKNKGWQPLHLILALLGSNLLLAFLISSFKTP